MRHPLRCRLSGRADMRGTAVEPGLWDVEAGDTWKGCR
jgi:hypothetical protein